MLRPLCPEESVGAPWTHLLVCTIPKSQVSFSSQSTGYGDEQLVSAHDVEKTRVSTEDVKMSDSTPADSGRSTPLSSSDAAKKAKKAEKKARKKAKRKDSLA